MPRISRGLRARDTSSLRSAVGSMRIVNATVAAHPRQPLPPLSNQFVPRAAAAGCSRVLCGCQLARASANLTPSGIWSGGKPEAASSRPLKLKKEIRAVISQIARSFQPAFLSDPISSLFTRLGVSVSLLAYPRSARVLESNVYSGHVVANSWPRCSSPVRRRTAAVWSPSQGAPPTLPLTTVAIISRWSRLRDDDLRR